MIRLNAFFILPALVTLAAAHEVPVTVYLATERGILKSGDAGRTWAVMRDSYPSEQARVVAAHPTVPDVVFAGGRDGLFRSLDGGNSWKPVIAVEGSVQAILFAESSVIYVVADRFWRSRNDGETWDVFAAELSGPLSVAVDNANADRLFLLTKTGLFRTDDGGATFVQLRPAFYPPAGISVITGAAGTRDVYVAYHGGIRFSPDSGVTWTDLAMRSPTGSGEVDGRPMFEMVFTGTHSIAVDRQDANRRLACGLVRIIAWDGYELVSGPGIYQTNSTGGWVTGMHDNGAFQRPGPPPDCFFAVLDSNPDGGAWIGTARGLLYAPPGPWFAWSEVEDLRDVAVYGATFSKPHEPKRVQSG